MSEYNAAFLIENTLVVVPTFNAEKTIVQTIEDIKKVGFKNILICDDKSTDHTVLQVNSLKDVTLICQQSNKGYGANQKKLYNEAQRLNYKYVVMVHGDHQYNPLLIPSMCWLLYSGSYDVVMGSRIIGGHPLKNGMPFYKYFANRVLTYFQNIVTGSKLSEYHSGLRAYKMETLNAIEFNTFSDNFIFDNQLILACLKKKLKIGEISCQTKFNHLTSSISFRNSITYGLGIVKYSLLYILKK